MAPRTKMIARKAKGKFVPSSRDPKDDDEIVQEMEEELIANSEQPRQPRGN